MSPPLGPRGAVEPCLLYIAKIVQLHASSSHQSHPQNSARAPDTQQGCAEWNQIELLNLQTKVLIFFFKSGGLTPLFFISSNGSAFLSKEHCENRTWGTSSATSNNSPDEIL